MSKCKNCGYDNPPDNRFCGNCGAQLPSEELCSSCGAPLSPTPRFAANAARPSQSVAPRAARLFRPTRFLF